MINSIFIALSGMQGHQRGLSVISNNVANMNTPGFRGSTVNFADVFLGGGSGLAGHGLGSGLNASTTTLDLRAGEVQQTGNDLDLRLEGPGFFILEDEHGNRRYTRNGSFEFNAAGELVVKGQSSDSSGRTSTYRVLGRTTSGQLAPVTLQGLQQSPFKPTTEVIMEKNLSTGDTAHTIDSVAVYDKKGGKHTLKLEFAKEAATTPPSTNIKWKMTVSEGGIERGTATLEFMSNGSLNQSTATPTLMLSLTGAEPFPVKFDFSSITGHPLGTNSDLAVKKQDGAPGGEISSKTFDESGVLKIGYSNGEKANGPRLMLAVIPNEAELEQRGNSLFEYVGTQLPVLREAGTDLKVKSQSLERSNVDLTEEFSELILIQRGYQASSQAASTANEMLQELLGLRRGR